MNDGFRILNQITAPILTLMINGSFMGLKINFIPTI